MLLRSTPALAFHSQSRTWVTAFPVPTALGLSRDVLFTFRLELHPQEQDGMLLCTSPEQFHQGQSRSLQERQTSRDTCPRQEPLLKSNKNQAAEQDC